MKTLLRWIALAPLAAALLVFALVNRPDTTVTFDPFGGNSAALTFTQPLFVMLGSAGMIGVAAGGIATWLAQGRRRRAARQALAELARLRAENERLNAAARNKVTPLAIARSGESRTAA